MKWESRRRQSCATSWRPRSALNSSPVTIIRHRPRAPRRRSAPTTCMTSACTTSRGAATGRRRWRISRAAPSGATFPEVLPTGVTPWMKSCTGRRSSSIVSSASASSSARRCRTPRRSARVARFPRAATGAPPPTAAPRRGSPTWRTRAPGPGGRSLSGRVRRRSRRGSGGGSPGAPRTAAADTGGDAEDERSVVSGVVVLPDAGRPVVLPARLQGGGVKCVHGLAVAAGERQVQALRDRVVLADPQVGLVTRSQTHESGEFLEHPVTQRLKRRFVEAQALLEVLHPYDGVIDHLCSLL